MSYLDAALEGDFAGHLLSLATAVRGAGAASRLGWRVDRVQAHGHSSGLDCLLGFLLVARQA
ncbi:hypothetical protein J2T47_000587 [Pseudomonas nitroreducens]|nr:hypothetical protein [Pseudomonas nitroreducens]